MLVDNLKSLIRFFASRAASCLTQKPAGQASQKRNWPMCCYPAFAAVSAPSVSAHKAARPNHRRKNSGWGILAARSREATPARFYLPEPSTLLLSDFEVVLCILFVSFSLSIAPRCTRIRQGSLPARCHITVLAAQELPGM